jgi:hypothetical protein
MKNARIWITTILLLTAASLCLQAQTADIAEHSMDDRTCSNASVAGAWAFTETGTFIPTTGAAPFAAVASYTLDSNGISSGLPRAAWAALSASLRWKEVVW